MGNDMTSSCLGEKARNRLVCHHVGVKTTHHEQEALTKRCVVQQVIVQAKPIYVVHDIAANEIGDYLGVVRCLPVPTIKE